MFKGCVDVVKAVRCGYCDGNRVEVVCYGESCVLRDER